MVTQYFRNFGVGLLQLYPRGLSTFWLAPIIPLIAILPEFAQHIVEVQLGMFESKEAAKIIQNDPLRWQFGYVKVAGLVLAIFLSARFWHKRLSQQHDPAAGAKGSSIKWLALLAALLANVAYGAMQTMTGEALTGVARTAVEVIFSIGSIPLLVWLLATVFADHAMTFRRALTHGWLVLLPLAIYLPLAFIPGQWLHGLNHEWAMGASPALLWGLMIFDSLVVGAMAVLTGAALAVAYRFSHGSSLDLARLGANRS